jgi:hypothetical protein
VGSTEALDVLGLQGVLTPQRLELTLDTGLEIVGDSQGNAHPTRPCRSRLCARIRGRPQSACGLHALCGSAFTRT